MFQTEIIIFIQLLGSDFLTAFFKFFTEIGRSNFTIPLLIIIMFGINFRKGFILSWAVIWNGIFTDFFKNLFALPRPANVDSNVLFPGTDYPNPTTFKSMGAKSFFGKIPGEVVDHLRIHRIDSWGFPSGHASNAMTLWGLIYLMFKKTWVRIIAVIFIILIPLSRMYLGRHFLADILGGLFLGLIIVLLFFKFVFKNQVLKKYLFEEYPKIKFDLKSIILITCLFIIPILLFFIPIIDPEIMANLLGLNLAFFLIRLRGFPIDSGTVLARFSRIIITGIIYYGLKILLTTLFSLLIQNEVVAVECAIKINTISFAIWISTKVNLKLGLFKEKLE
jgi:membrane-associated phospholipid phosphatase